LVLRKLLKRGVDIIRGRPGSLTAVIGPLSKAGSIFNLVAFNALIAVGLVYTDLDRISWVSFVQFGLAEIIFGVFVFVAWRSNVKRS
jgi:hypothetical protein